MMRGSLHAGPVACLIAGALLLLMMHNGCEEKIKPSVAPSGLGQDVPSQESWNAKITFTDSGRVTAVLHAGHIAMFSERRVTVLDSNIVVDFYDDHGNHSSVLTARRGVVNDISHDFEAHENVVVVSDSGSTLRTEDLYWSNHDRKVHTPAYVDITSPTERIEGQGFESDQGLKHYTIYRVSARAKSNG